MADAREWPAQAQAAFDAGDVAAALDLAVEGLSEFPDDVALLRLAGRAALDLDHDDAARHCERLVKTVPDDADAWRLLGTAYLDEGAFQRAAEAFRHALKLTPDDNGVLVNLAHVVYALGRNEEAVSLLSKAAQTQPENVENLHHLVDMHRRSGRLNDALTRARQIAQWDPDDVVAAMDIADLSLTMGNFSDAAAAYDRLRAIDRDDGHEVHAYHGMVEAEIRRQQWRRALDLAIAATRVDRHDLTTQLLAFVSTKMFGPGEHPAPEWAELEGALVRERAEHRRMHEEALVP